MRSPPLTPRGLPAGLVLGSGFMLGGDDVPFPSPRLTIPHGALERRSLRSLPPSLQSVRTKGTPIFSPHCDSD